jgi:hypothetical protein
MELVPGYGRKFCFCEDPFGNILKYIQMAISSSEPTLSFRPELFMISPGALTSYSYSIAKRRKTV